MEFRLTVIALLVGTIGLLSSCYEPPEGCRDIHALNFDVRADSDCEEPCCDYPELKLYVTPQYDSIQLDTNTYFSHPSADSVRIRYLSMYLSDFRLAQGENHDTARIEETISVSIGTQEGSESVILPFPVAKVKLKTGVDAYKLGTFSKADRYTQLEFDFGIRKEINHADLERIVTSNPLYQNQDSMYIDRDAGFYFLKMTIAYKGGEKKISLPGDEYLQHFTIAGDFDFREREERSIHLTMNYENWLKNVDLISDSPEIIGDLMADNLKNSLIFTE